MARLLLAVIFGLWALLVFIHTENLSLFKLTIGATEYGHWLALSALLLALSGNKKSRVGKISASLLAVSALALLWPVTQAFLLARRVPSLVEKAFPGELPPAEAISFHKLWLGTKVAAIPPQKSVYATHGEAPLSLYFYPARNNRPAPCVIILHSGGWFSGNAREFEKMNCWLAERGYAVAAVEYRLAPQWTWPAQRDDVLDAMHYLQSNAARLQIDATRMVLFGRSAGGQIAEAVAYENPAANIHGCIAFYAPADLHFAYRYARSDDILDSLKLLKDYLGGTPEMVREKYDSASAILHVTPQSAPTLLIHGTPDKLVWVKQSRRFAAVLAENKTSHLFLEFPWATHAFDCNFDGPGGQISRYAVERFLAHVMK